MQHSWTTCGGEDVGPYHYCRDHIQSIPLCSSVQWPIIWLPDFPTSLSSWTYLSLPSFNPCQVASIQAHSKKKALIDYQGILANLPVEHIL